MVKRLAFLALLGFGFALLLTGYQTYGAASSSASECGKPRCTAESEAACGMDFAKSSCPAKGEQTASCGEDCAKPCCAEKSEAKASCGADCGAEKGAAACKTKCPQT